MSVISWITGNIAERLAGRNHPTYPDVINRPLRQFVSYQGYDPDGSDFSLPVIYAHSQAGANAGLKIQAAITAVAAVGGGIVDARGLIGAQTIDVNMFSGLTQEVPLKIKFGAATFTVSASQQPYGKLSIELNRTTFALADGTVPWFMWDFNAHVGSGAAQVTNGSNQVTILSGPSGVTLEPGRAFALFGHTAEHGGRDNSTLNGAIDNVQTTIQLVSTAGLSNLSYMKVDNEIIRIGTVDSSTQISGCTRGAQGTVAASHVDTSATDRIVYQSYEIVAVSGSTVTLDEPFVGMSSSGSGRGFQCGASDVTFEGTGTFDGSKPPTNSPNNAGCIGFFYGTRLKVARTITIKSFDHSGVHCDMARSCEIDGNYRDMGWPLESLGFTVLFFHGSKYCTAYGDYENCNYGPGCDDRTTQPGINDNATVGCVLKPRTIRHVHGGVILEGTIRSTADVPFCDDWGLGGGGFAIAPVNSPQWVTAPTLVDNVAVLGYANPAANAVSIGGATTDGFTVIYKRSSGTISGGLPNGVHIVGKQLILRGNSGGAVSIDIDGRLIISGGPGIQLGQGGQAKINLDGNDSSFASNEMGLGENNGNMILSVRGTFSVVKAVDATVMLQITNAGILNLRSGGEVQFNGTRVVNARKTGWAAWTGTSNRATKDTSTATLTDVAQTLKALIDDLHNTAGHGLIGT